MPKSGKRPERNPILGVSFGNDQIRVVEVRRAGAEYTVTAAGSVAIPAGALDPGSSVSPDTIAQRLKNVIKKAGATTTHAVFGVPSTSVFTRLLDIPQIPDEELEPVVAGEVAHYQMIRPDGGAFGFAKLPTPDSSRDTQVLVMAADDPILHLLEQVAKKSGLHAVCKEPSQLGAIRTAFQTNFSEATLMISIEDAATEIAVVDGSKLMLYRRIDVGGKNLLANSMALAGVAAGGDSGIRKSAPSSVDEVLSARLATEIRRSMDYFRRQFPMSDVGQAVVTSMDSRLDSMAEYLEGALGIHCRIAVANVRASGAAASELGTPISSEYFGAIGLAMGELGYGSTTIPTIDLVPSSPRKEGTIGISTGVLASTIVTAAILVLGFVRYTTLTSETTQAQDHTKQLIVQAKRLNDELAPKRDQYNQDVQLLTDLARQGTPFPVVMDKITEALDPSVGISEIHFDGTHIRLSGEAKNEAAMVNTLDHIRTQGSFTSPYVDSFQNQTGQGGIDFNLSSDFVVGPALGQTTTTPPIGANTATPGGAQ